MGTKGTKKAEIESVTRYTKAQLIRARRYRDQKDVLSAVLQEGMKYSFTEADKAVEEFMKGKVKTC